MRDYDITVGCENIFAELMDLSASGAVQQPIDGFEIVELLRTRYDALADGVGEESRLVRLGVVLVWIGTESEKVLFEKLRGANLTGLIRELQEELGITVTACSPNGASGCACSHAWRRCDR